MKTYEGKVAFVTGASSGIGAALAHELARQGADVVLAARRAERLQEVAHAIEGLGRRAHVVTCDVTDDESVAAAAEEARRAFGKLDVVVANAGFGVTGSLERLTLEDYRRQMETNVFGVLRTIYATVEELKRNRGRLAIVGSVAGRVTFPGTSAYSMSKAAVSALAEALRHELAPQGVSVTLVSPGFVESEIRLVDNHGRLRSEAKDIVPRWLRMPTDRAARKIARAIARGQGEAVITFHGKLTVWLHRHAPWLTSLMLARGARGKIEPKGA